MTKESYRKFINAKFIFLVIGGLIIFTAAVLFAYYLNAGKKLSYEYFYKGVYIDGVDVSGLTKAEAYEAIKLEIQKNHKSTSINLRYNENSWEIPLGSVDFSYAYEATINRAYKLGRTGNWINRITAINRLRRKPVNLIVAAKYNKVKLMKILSKIKNEVDFSATNSTFNYNYGRIVYTNDIDGRKLDLETNTELIERKLLNRDFSDAFLEVQTVKPSITVADVSEIRDVLGVFSTRYNSNSSNRSHNIEVAGNKINNYILLPGEEFSMDYALGPRTSSNGYMQAPIIMKSRIVPGTGGGICQVATTLYNAVLLSSLKVTKRVHHSIPLGYVPPGQDATISEGYIDLKFKNNRDYTICIATEVRNGTITVKIIGKKAEAETEKKVLRSVIVEEYAPPEPEYVINNGLSDGQVRVLVRERKGMRVVLYRDTYNKQGALTDSEIISEDIYKPVRGKFAVSRRNYKP